MTWARWSSRRDDRERVLGGKTPWTQGSLRDEWLTLVTSLGCRRWTSVERLPLCACVGPTYAFMLPPFVPIDRCHHLRFTHQGPDRSPPSFHNPPPVSRNSSRASYPLLPLYSLMPAHYTPTTHIPMARLLSPSHTPARTFSHTTHCKPHPSSLPHSLTSHATTHAPLTHRNHTHPATTHVPSSHAHYHAHPPTHHPHRTNRTSAKSASPSV